MSSKVTGIDRKENHTASQGMADIMRKLGSESEQEQFVEGLALLLDNLQISRSIVNVAGGKKGYVTIEEFDNINEAKMARYLHLLVKAGVLYSEMSGDDHSLKRVYMLTDFGKYIHTLFNPIPVKHR